MLFRSEAIIRDELNVKDVVFKKNEEELVEYKARPNYRLLGKKLGKDMKYAAGEIEKLSMPDIQSLMDGAVLSLQLGDRNFDLTIDGIQIVRIEKEKLKVINEGSLTVALDSELTEELVQEGIIRDMVRSIQNLRKEMGFKVTDRIFLRLYGTDSIKRAVENFYEHLTGETLSTQWSWEKVDGSKEIECGEEKCFISIEKTA